MLHRKKLLSNGEVRKNAFGATEPINRSTLDRHANALTLLFRFQVAQGQLPADAPAPNDGGALTDINQRLSKSTTTTRKKNYLPRGKATVKVDYSNAQHLQLCHYGLIDGAPGARGCSTRMMRIHHVLSHASLLRWDDKQSIAWADVFVQKAPLDEGPQDCVVLTISLDDGKCNADGAWHQAGTMRNVRSPAECPHFGTAYEMFHQFELLRIGPKYDDFRPRPEVDPDDGETKVVRPWFDSLVFNGTNAEKQRDGTAPGDYSTVRRACKRMHESTTPPMNQNGVALHMERGVSARDKEYHGLRPDQSKKAGRWKTGRGAHEISTPTACLATSCASPAASPRCTPATSTR
ncbi:hypothetical protein M885DRAFT_282939 [Pelagophyceae sp. CCMP2097]|nr:hypothetical protein M885DRAFT_282939 [Pelagophyceae sp. CCMP2097]